MLTSRCKGFTKIVTHEPLGVCAAINPFNAPVPTMMLKCLPALATGNVIIVKPSEKTPLGSLAVAPLFEKAGIPKVGYRSHMESTD